MDDFEYWNERDWTRDPETHRSNSSAEFIALVDEVARLLRENVHLGDAPEDIARLIMAQLAHRHHLAPQKRQEEGDAEHRT